MALQGAPFSYDQSSLLTGPLAWFYAPGTQALPTKIEDVMATKAPYAPAAGWIVGGATNAASNYSVNPAYSDLRIEQTAPVILRKVTDMARKLLIASAEIRPDILQIMEGAPSIATVAAVPGANLAQKKVAFGNLTSLSTYRVACVMQRDAKAGTVLETAGSTPRGRFWMLSAFQCSISADAVTLEMDRQALTSPLLSFDLYPDPTQPGGQEVGATFDEPASATAI